MRRFVPEAISDSGSGTLVSQRGSGTITGLESRCFQPGRLSCRKPWFEGRRAKRTTRSSREGLDLRPGVSQPRSKSQSGYEETYRQPSYRDFLKMGRVALSDSNAPIRSSIFFC